jgi:leader peptidase (prepilin peptidase)/N-methyltransferase
MNITTGIVFVAGLILGSLLNILVVRLPREREMGGWPRCTRCGKSLGLWQLIPLLGWLIQRGQGRCCGRRLQWIFPLVELISGLALVAFFLRYGLTGTFFFLCFVTAVLVLTGAIDWLHRSIYTLFILVPVVIAVVASPFVPTLGLLNSVVGAIMAGFTFVILFMLARVLFPAKASPFGLGDVYLGIFIGAVVGVNNMMPALFYGILLAGIFSAIILVLRRTGRQDMPEYISYGTFLCLGTLGFLALQGLPR